MNNTYKKNIIKLLFSQSVSIFGSSLVEFAIIWHITLTTESGVMMMVATLCTFLPRLIVSFFSGVIIDKYNRKILIILSDGFVALVTLVLAVLYINGFQNLILIFITLALRSIGTGIQTPSINSFIAQIVNTKDLLRVNGINNSLQSLITLIAPAISGVIMATISLSLIFFIDVITAIAAIIIMSLIKYEKKSGITNVKNNYIVELRAGIEYVKNNKLIKHMLVILSVYYLLITPVALLCQLIIARNFGNEVWRLTLNEVFFSIGSMIGGILISKIGKMFGEYSVLIYSCLIIGILNVFLGFTNFTLFIVTMFVLGTFMALFSSAQISIIQKNVDSRMHGRVFGFVQIVTNAGFPIGMIVFGPLGDYVDLLYIFSFAGIGLFILGVLLRFKQKKCYKN